MPTTPVAENDDAMPAARLVASSGGTATEAWDEASPRPPVAAFVET
jgi:hypothetical protein